MIDKLARVGTYKGYMYLIKHIYRNEEYNNFFREMLEGVLMSTNWYNGYVILPDDHELVDKFYGDFEKDYDLEVHGGITFSDYLSKIMDLENKAFWVIEENHEGEWIEVLKICENQADVDSVVNFYLENRRKSLYEN